MSNQTNDVEFRRARQFENPVKNNSLMLLLFYTKFYRFFI